MGAHVYDARTNELKFEFMAYENGIRGGVRVATGDVNRDGFPDVVTAYRPRPYEPTSRSSTARPDRRLRLCRLPWSASTGGVFGGRERGSGRRQRGRISRHRHCAIARQVDRQGFREPGGDGWRLGTDPQFRRIRRLPTLPGWRRRGCGRPGWSVGPGMVARTLSWASGSGMRSQIRVFDVTVASPSYQPIRQIVDPDRRPRVPRTAMAFTRLSPITAPIPPRLALERPCSMEA